jgi:hypothetical protein
MGLQLPRCRSRQVYARQRTLKRSHSRCDRSQCPALISGDLLPGRRFFLTQEHFKFAAPPGPGLAQAGGSLRRTFDAPVAADTCAALPAGGAAADCFPATARPRRTAEPVGLLAFALDDFFLADCGFRPSFFAAGLSEAEANALAEARSQAL